MNLSSSGNPHNEDITSHPIQQQQQQKTPTSAHTASFSSHVSSHSHHSNEGIGILTEYNPMTSSFHLEPIDIKHPERTIAKPMLDVMGEELARLDTPSTPHNDDNNTIDSQHHEKVPQNLHHDGLQRQPLYKTIGYSIYYIGSGSTSSFVLGLLLPKLVVQMLGSENKELYLSIVVSIATVIGVIVSPIVGNISDRIGRKSRIPIVVVTTLVWALMIILQSICSMMHTQFPQYYVFIFVMYGAVLCIGKCGYVTSQAIVTAMVTDLFPQEQINLVSALVGVFTLIGVMLGVVLGGVIIGHVDLIWVCLGYAALCSIVCVPLMLFHRELRKTKVKQIEKEAAKKPGEFEDVPLTTEPAQEAPKPRFYKRALNYALAFLVPFKNRNFTWVFITRFTIQLTNAAARNYFFYFIQEVLTPYNFILTNKFPTNNEEALSLFLGIVFAFTFVSALFAQKIAGLIGRRYVYSAGALGCGIASIILIIFRSYSVMILCCSILYGLGIGSFISVDLSLVNSVLITKDDSGKDLALWNISGTVPELLGVPLGGLIILIGDAIAPDVVGMGYLLLYALGASLQVLSSFMIFCVRLSRAQDTGNGQPVPIHDQIEPAHELHFDAAAEPTTIHHNETPILEEEHRNEIELKE